MIMKKFREKEGKRVKKIIFKLEIAILFIFPFCSSHSDNQEEQNIIESGIQTIFEIECDENWFFSKYDLDMYIDDEYVGFVSHGGNETIEENLEKGSHKIKFTNTEDSEVTGKVEN